MIDDLYSGWFNFTKEFECAVEKQTANIFSIKYEDLKIVSLIIHIITQLYYCSFIIDF